MAQPVIKTSFASGEWAPKLRGRVDIQKYHAGAALMRNFFVDYAGGGASTRQGTRYVNQTKLPSTGVRLIPFQPSSTLSYVLEFGQNYIRFFSNGSPILEAPKAIQSITPGNPVTVNSTGHGFVFGDWVFLSTPPFPSAIPIGNFYIVEGTITANSYQLTNLVNQNVLTAAGTQAQRVFTLSTPYNAADLFPDASTGNPGLKYLQDVTSLIITHPNYPPMVLTELSPTNWTLTPIPFAPTINPPSISGAGGTGGVTTYSYLYAVTSVDANGQESTPATTLIQNGLITNVTSPSTNTITWTAVPGAVNYNIYRSTPFLTAGLSVTGPTLGFISSLSPGPVTTAVSFQESSPGIAPDFSQGPPVSPSTGGAISAVNITSNPNITAVPAVIIARPPNGFQAAASATAQVSGVGVSSIVVSSTDPSQGSISVNPTGAQVTLPNGVVVKINSANPLGGVLWSVTSLTFLGGGNTNVIGPLSSSIPLVNGQVWASPPGSDYSVHSSSSGGGPGSVTITSNLLGINVTQPGSGYLTVPAVSFSTGGTTAVAVLGPTFGGVSINPIGQGNPGVPGFYQQRLALGAPPGAVQSYFMSQPEFFFNFNVSFPSQDTDAIAGTIVGEDLNDIRSFIDSPTGIIALTGKGAWLINGGGGLGSTTPITPANQTANPQAFNGANDLRPIKINRDILYGTNKGNYFRDLSYNIYANIYTGDDITVLSNHLFFGHFSPDWAWSEEPFKTLWVVRDDGILLSLGYVKEQELMGWAHHDTDGQFLSVCTVIENVNGNIVDAVYVIVQRLVEGFFVQYVERFADRFFPYGAEDAWSVDCGLQTIPIETIQSTLFFESDGSVVGNQVFLVNNQDAPFQTFMTLNNWIVRAGGGVYMLNSFVSSQIVQATVVQVSPNLNPYTNVPIPVTLPWTIWQPQNTFNLSQLAGKNITGVADGQVVPQITVPASGTVTLGTFATKVTLGLAFTPQLQTLPLDLGEPTIQSKRKKLPAVTLRVADTLGLQAGTSFANVLNFKDFTVGNVGTLSDLPVTGLVSGDGRMILDQFWQEPGQICIQQNQPYPATILAVIPEVTVGDSK